MKIDVIDSQRTDTECPTIPAEYLPMAQTAGLGIAAAAAAYLAGRSSARRRQGYSRSGRGSLVREVLTTAAAWAIADVAAGELRRFLHERRARR